MTRVELENLRRSLSASGGLPRDEVDPLIAETAGLLVERQRIANVLESLRGPWTAVRHGLNDLQRALRSGEGDRRPEQR